MSCPAFNDMQPLVRGLVIAMCKRAPEPVLLDHNLPTSRHMHEHLIAAGLAKQGTLVGSLAATALAAEVLAAAGVDIVACAVDNAAINQMFMRSPDVKRKAPDLPPLTTNEVRGEVQQLANAHGVTYIVYRSRASGRLLIRHLSTKRKPHWVEVYRCLPEEGVTPCEY